MESVMEVRSENGYALSRDEGEAFWLFGMLQVVKIGKAESGGAHGLQRRERVHGEQLQPGHRPV